MSDPREIGRSKDGGVRARRLATVLLATSLASCAAPISLVLAADAGWVESVSIVERGIYTAIDAGPFVRRGSLGPVSRIARASLLRSTDVIPARKSLRFGLRYVLEGTPQGSAVDIKLVTRFPDPGLLDPSTGIKHLSSEYTITGQVGVVAYREFQFDESWEIVPGEWVFEFWQSGRQVGSQTFCIVNSLAKEGRTGQPCSVLMGQRTKFAFSDDRSFILRSK